jgi:hypothetical protein
VTLPDSAYPIDEVYETVDLMGSLLEADRGSRCRAETHTPDEPASCKQRKQPQREHGGRIIWNPEPFYPIIQEPLPDLTPLTRLKWPDER